LPKRFGFGFNWIFNEPVIEPITTPPLCSLIAPCLTGRAVKTGSI
jgi:hypothetical protein